MSTKITKNRLTIKDIAQLSGVSKSTVSRVINNAGNVSTKARLKVESVIHQHQFIPSKSAQALRGMSDKVVCIMVSRLDSHSEHQAVQGMLPLLLQYGYVPIVIESQFNNNIIAENLAMLQHRNIDGIILFAFSDLNYQLLDEWKEQLVLIARKHKGFSSVTYDEYNSIAKLMYWLLKRDHYHIGYIGVDQRDISTGLLRYQAYHNICLEQNLPHYSQLGELSLQTGYQLAPKVLTKQMTALICATDTIALGACKYLQQHSYKHIQVCSIGNNNLLHFLFPNILSVDPGYKQVGGQAVKLLLQLFNGQSPGYSQTVEGQLTEYFN